MSGIAIKIRPARTTDARRLQTIREAAFAPVFASFRSILGDDIYKVAQEKDDASQGALLTSMLAPDSNWELFAVELGAEVVGFVSIKLDTATLVGEIGLNAVHPSCGGTGIGTRMYDFAVARMKDAGMKVATVATGGDPSHAPARRAYFKAGFSVEIPSVWMCRTL